MGKTISILGSFYIRLKNIKSDILQVLKMLLGKSISKTIYIGDSHIWYIATKTKSTKKSRIHFNSNGDLILWLGPKLMYTIGAKGFKFSILQKASLYIANKKNYKNLIAHFGEIDCRVWSSKLDNIENIDLISKRYILQIENLCNFYGFTRSLLISPIPPSDKGQLNLEFPRNGSLATRVQVTNRLTQSLIANRRPNYIEVLNSQSLVGSNPSSADFGALDEIYSLDGCHVNPAGAELLKRYIDEFLHGR
jgi:hypothetical protein